VVWGLMLNTAPIEFQIGRREGAVRATSIRSIAGGADEAQSGEAQVLLLPISDESSCAGARSGWGARAGAEARGAGLASGAGCAAIWRFPPEAGSRIGQRPRRSSHGRRAMVFAGDDGATRTARLDRRQRRLGGDEDVRVAGRGRASLARDASPAPTRKDAESSRDRTAMLVYERLR